MFFKHNALKCFFLGLYCGFLLIISPDDGKLTFLEGAFPAALVLALLTWKVP